MNPPSLHEFDDPKSTEFLSEGIQYKVRPAMNSAYKSASRRFLCVWGSVPTNALRTGSLLEKSATKKSFDNLFSVIPQASNLDDDTGFMLVNFNHAKTAGKTESEQNTLMVQFTKRIEYFIEKYKPTDIIVFGDGPAARLWFGSDTTPNRDELPRFTAMRGNVRKHPKHKLRFTYTFDIEYLCRNSEADDASREDTALVDLLYMVSRHLDNAFAGVTQFSAASVKPNPIFVDSIALFDDLMSKLEANRIVAYDCETANLSSYSNTLLTSQFAVTPNEGYIVPHKHKDTPKVFDAKQRRYVNQSLQNWFKRTPKKGSPLPILVGTNIQFDLRIARVFYGLNFIFNRVWDITAGESLLDENTGILDKATFPDFNNESRKTTMGNLRNMACGYGNPLYYTLPFSKEQRLTIASVDIVGDKAKDVWDYMTLDVQLPLRIMELQLERALYVEQTQGLHDWQSLYKRHVSHQMNNTIHAISHMHQHGSYIDTDYLSKLADKRKSPLIGEIQEIEKRIQSSEVVTNFLLESSTKPGSKSGQAGGLFASIGKSDTAFDINKPANKKAIFFGENYLNLTPINVSKITKEPAVDKLLFSTYKHTVPLAADYADWTILNKFLSTYVNAWNESLQDDIDGSKDGCLRPSFGFFNVVTGRLNSFKPSLHQIPSRASTAKKIKKSFIAKPGMLQVKWDFSAHEVRMWGNEAYDPGIGELFRIGQRLRQEWIKLSTPGIKFPLSDKDRGDLEAELARLTGKKSERISEIEAILKKDSIAKELKTKGDIHVANVARFFGVWVSKDDPLRDAIKAVIFGVLYGKSPATLAKDIFKKDKEIAKLKEKIAAGDKKATRELARLEEDPDQYALDMANGILSKLWSSYPKGENYILGCEQSIEDRGFSMSQIGRRRNLYGVLSGIKSIIASSRRRGKNAPIQGVASEVGITSGYLVLKEYATIYADENNILYKDLGLDAVDFIEYNRTVHDANYYQVPLCMVLPSVHIKLDVATYGVTKYFKDVFGFDFQIEPEIELEISYSDDASHKWDFDIYNLLVNCILASVCESHGTTLDGFKETRNVNVVQDMETILFAWKNPRTLKLLNSRYPLLGQDTSHVIQHSLKRLKKDFDL